MSNKKHYLVLGGDLPSILGYYHTTEAGIKTITKNLRKKHEFVYVLTEITSMSININSYLDDYTIGAIGAELNINFAKVHLK